MLAALYHGAGRIELVTMPRPAPGPGELLVRVTACGLCGSDLMTWYQDPRAPLVLGHEPVGVVEEAGEGAPFAPGDRVFVHHHVPCMTCARCRAGRHTLCDTFRATRIDPGGLAEFIRVPAENARLDVLRVPEGMSDLTATLIEPLACIVRGQRAADVGPDSRVAVVGAGSMGLLEIATARALGARTVVAVEPRPERRAMARDAGAECPDRDGPDAAMALLGGDGADVVFVTTSAAEAIDLGLRLAAPGGTVQLFSPPRPGAPLPVDLGAVWFREVRVTSTYSAGPFDTREALELLASGAVEADAVITHRVPLRDVEEAFRLARSGEAVKVVVEFPGG